MIFNKIQEIGAIKLSEELEDRIREAVAKAAQACPVHLYRRRDAQRRIESVACEAIAQTIYEEGQRNGRLYTITPGWPQAQCMISDDEANIDIFIGHDYTAHDPEPIRVVLNRHGRRDMSERLGAAISKPFKAKHAGPVGKPAKPPVGQRAPAHAQSAPADRATQNLDSKQGRPGVKPQGKR